MAEQNYSAVQEKLIAVRNELDSRTLEHDRLTHQWQDRVDEQLNHINSLQTELSHTRQQLHDNRCAVL